MKFCPSCKNMLFGLDETAVNGVKTAVRSCRKCTYTEAIDKNSPLIYEHTFGESRTNVLTLNPYIEFDETLNHLEITCPNKCTVKDVVAVKLDSQKLIWMYKCTQCKVMWKQASHAS